MDKKYKRILLKLSGEFLGGKSGLGFDFKTIMQLAEQLAEIHRSGVEVGIVLGGGNFFRGTRDIPMKMDRVEADKIGMMATLMNGVCVKEALKDSGLEARVLTGLPAPSVAEPFDKQRALRCFDAREILIFAGGTGNPFFSTDTASVLRALEIEADIVIKGTKVDGVYDSDPVKNPAARKYENLTYSIALEKDLRVMDAAAIALCRENKMPLCVLSISNRNDLREFLQGKDVGTLITT